MKKITSSKTVIVLITMLFVFVLPIMIAFYLYNQSNNVIYKTTNYGRFAELTFDSSFLAVDSTNTKWLLSYFHRGKCTKDCVFNLTKLESIYLAVGKNKDKVKSAFITTDNSIKIFPSIKDLKITAATNADISALFTANKIPPSTTGAYFILDPQARYVLYYPSEAQGNGILRDLRHLLKVKNG